MASPVRCDEAHIRSISTEECDAWLALGELRASDLGIPAVSTWVELRRVGPINLMHMVNDIRVCKFVVARILRSRDAYDMDNLVWIAVRLKPVVWLNSQRAFRDVARVLLRGAQQFEKTKEGRLILRRFLHTFPLRGADTVAVDQGNLRLRCSECGTLVPCKLGVLASFPVSGKPKGLRMTHTERTRLRQAVWLGHNEALKRDFAGVDGRTALPWWVGDTPPGMSGAALLGSDTEMITLRAMHRAAETLGEDPDKFVELMRARPSSMRPVEVRANLSCVMRTRDECDRVRGVWALSEACRARLLRKRLLGKDVCDAMAMDITRFPLGEHGDPKFD